MYPTKITSRTTLTADARISAYNGNLLFPNARRKPERVLYSIVTKHIPIMMIRYSCDMPMIESGVFKATRSGLINKRLAPVRKAANTTDINADIPTAL